MNVFFDAGDLDIGTFSELCAQDTRLSEYPLASGIEKKVLIYEGDQIRHLLDDEDAEYRLKAEINKCLDTGPGVLIVKRAYEDLDIIDRTTDLFMQIIEDEKVVGKAEGDHFGTNERIWNSLQKVCLRDPELFIDYYGAPVLALISHAWLGPYYQVTAQVNNVKPGNASQSPHRDYHLGFQSSEVVAQFPARAQIMSQYLTLQGAIAHTDMPIAAGPTLFLPHSQKFKPGYLAYRDPAFIDFFEKHHVQLPLEKGDAVYFSPALFHGAGTNSQATDRLANLVQISSAFGRPMESIDRMAMIEAVFPVLRKKGDHLSERRIQNTIAAIADGYAFPTNLDADPPVGGNAPQTAQDFVSEAIAGSWSVSRLMQVLEQYKARRWA